MYMTKPQDFEEYAKNTKESLKSRFMHAAHDQAKSIVLQDVVGEFKKLKSRATQTGYDWPEGSQKKWQKTFNDFAMIVGGTFDWENGKYTGPQMPGMS